LTPISKLPASKDSKNAASVEQAGGVPVGETRHPRRRMALDPPGAGEVEAADREAGGSVADLGRVRGGPRRALGTLPWGAIPSCAARP
jgi:hypothetical protein